MYMPRKWLIISGGALVLAVIIAALLAAGIIPGLKKRSKLVEMEFWGIDDKRAWQEIIADYQKENLGVKINYRRLSADDYENGVVNALAGARGPDIMMFQYDWLPKHGNKIVPADPQTFSVEKLRELFPTAVEQDFAPFGSVYALPLYMDTLSLLYNKDVFDKKGIALPPKTWKDFTAAAKKLGFGKTAIGGSSQTIDRGADILSLLMLQDGVQMTDFTRDGLAALDFYLSFSDPANPNYVWNDQQRHSLASFAEGQLGMMLGYRYHSRLIREQSPFLALEIAPAPQLSADAVDYPFYYGLAVTAASPFSVEAWKFIGYAATNRGAVTKYLNFVGELPALRSLIGEVGNVQALSARSWLKIDNQEIDRIFSEMISLILKGKDPSQALTEAEEKVNRLINSP